MKTAALKTSDSKHSSHPFLNGKDSPFFGPKTIQPKLKIGQPNDKYEQEADRVADAVVNTTEPQQGGQSLQMMEEEEVQAKLQEPVIQQKCNGCEHEEKLQTKADAPTAKNNYATPEISSQLQSRAGSGNHLPERVQTEMRHKIGADFSGVNIHTDSCAVQMNQALGAKAFTHGRDIYFNQGQYNPASPGGKHLLAHELTHVVQQASNKQKIQRQAVAVPNYRDCTTAITGVADSNEQLEDARSRAREFVGAAIRRLASAPVAGSVYATALGRHFISPNAAQRAAILANFQSIRATLRVSNYICNSSNICGTEQAFWIPQDDLVHVCRPFWSLSRTCQAIILVHEGAHDIGVDAALAAHPPNRGSANYPAGNVAPPVGQTTAQRMINPDAYAFFAAHVWRSTDTGKTCF